ncbi:MAG: hypothetical protein QF384_19920 [Alphaproteobacteria bacterium]|nr:hypothetical protein [Alphaproteobacteria bacterium]
MAETLTSASKAPLAAVAVPLTMALTPKPSAARSICRGASGSMAFFKGPTLPVSFTAFSFNAAMTLNCKGSEGESAVASTEVSAIFVVSPLAPSR